MSKAEALALKRERLLERSGQLRARWAGHAAAVAPALGAADAVSHSVRWLKANPQWLIGAGTLILVLKPRRTFRLARRTFFAWQGWLRLRPLLVERGLLRAK